MEQTGTRDAVSRTDNRHDSPVFLSSAAMARQTGNSPPHNPPKGGCVGGENNSPLPVSKRESMAEWVRENLPQCATIAAEFKALFQTARLVYAKEAGHEIVKPVASGLSLKEIQIGPLALTASDKNARKR